MPTGEVFQAGELRQEAAPSQTQEVEGHRENEEQHILPLAATVASCRCHSFVITTVRLKEEERHTQQARTYCAGQRQMQRWLSLECKMPCFIS